MMVSLEASWGRLGKMGDDDKKNVLWEKFDNMKFDDAFEFSKF